MGASIRFIEAFTPAALAKQAPDRLAMAFCVEGKWAPVAIEVWHDGHKVTGRYTGDLAR